MSKKKLLLRGFFRGPLQKRVGIVDLEGQTCREKKGGQHWSFRTWKGRRQGGATAGNLRGIFGLERKIGEGGGGKWALLAMFLK